MQTPRSFGQQDDVGLDFKLNKMRRSAEANKRVKQLTANQNWTQAPADTVQKAVCWRIIDSLPNVVTTIPTLFLIS